MPVKPLSCAVVNLSFIPIRAQRSCGGYHEGFAKVGEVAVHAAALARLVELLVHIRGAMLYYLLISDTYHIV